MGQNQFETQHKFGTYVHRHTHMHVEAERRGDGYRQLKQTDKTHKKVEGDDVGGGESVLAIGMCVEPWCCGWAMIVLHGLHIGCMQSTMHHDTFHRHEQMAATRHPQRNTNHRRHDDLKASHSAAHPRCECTCVRRALCVAQDGRHWWILK
jgi:hypothetical protein